MKRIWAKIVATKNPAGGECGCGVVCPVRLEYRSQVNCWLRKEVGNGRTEKLRDIYMRPGKEIQMQRD